MKAGMLLPKQPNIIIAYEEVFKLRSDMSACLLHLKGSTNQVLKMFEPTILVQIVVPQNWAQTFQKRLGSWQYAAIGRVGKGTPSPSKLTHVQYPKLVKPF